MSLKTFVQIQEIFIPQDLLIVMIRSKISSILTDFVNPKHAKTPSNVRISLVLL